MICGKSSGSEAPLEADGELRFFSALEFQKEIPPGRHFRHLNSNQQIHIGPPPAAQHVDIVPTVLDSVGLEIPHSLEGRSLLRILRTADEPSKPRKVFSYQLDSRRARSIIDGSWKLIQHRGILRDIQLYHHQDSAEQVNLFDKNRVRSGYLLSLLKAHEQGPRKKIQSTKIKIYEKLRKQLNALGYLQ